MKDFQLSCPEHSDVFSGHYLREYQDFLLRIEQIKADWTTFAATGKTESLKYVRPEVLSSWLRCRRAGVEPQAEGAVVRLDQQELALRLERNRDFIDVATPLLDSLAANVAGSGFRVDLFDKDLYFLKQFGEAETIEMAVKRGSVLGACRSEAANGTNAINLAAVLGQPVQLVGPEHYNIHSHIWTCSSTPVYDESKNLLGVINVAGHFSKVHSHTLGMVIALGKAIEHNMRLHRLYKEKATAFAYLENIVESISEGLIALNGQGEIALINRTAAQLLDIMPKEAQNRPCDEVFDPQSTILDAHKSGKALTDKELTFSRNNKRKTLIGNVAPIRSQNAVEGTLAVFKSLGRARSFVKTVAGFQAYFNFNDLIGNGSGFGQAVSLARQAASLPSNVLLVGESGTGKELFAQATHNASAVKDGPFVGINCAAIPAELIESELFGYEGGAFTGARQDGKPGKFQLAEGGTLFLDEVNAMPVTMQAKLLRALQNRSFFRVGGVQEIPFNARVIAATNRDLWEEVRQGNFREDLFYRLNVITIEIPPLREHKEDIPQLARYFCEKLAEKFNFPLTISQESLQILGEYDWPGNVRELENVIERCAVLVYSRESRVIEPGDLLGCPGIRNFYAKQKQQASADMPALPAGLAQLDLMERDMIRDTLHRAGGNISRAAKELGITRRTLYKKIEKYQIS